MNRGRIIVSTSIVCGLCVSVVQSNVNAQDPGDAGKSAQTADAGGVAIEFSKEAGTGEGVETENAEEQAIKFITSKGWTQDTESDGFFTVIGTSTLSCGPDSKDFQRCRQMAYSTAMLNAKTQLAEYLRAEVSTELESSVGNPGISKPPIPGKTDLTLYEKGLLLLNSEVDKLMAERGVDVGSPKETVERKEIEKDVLQSKEFESAIELQAIAEISGLQAYRTFETSLKGKKGSIAVVAIHSPKSAQLQSALLGNGEAPRAAVQMSIREWAQTEGPEVLLYTQGAQPRSDQKGEVVLVGFGQAVGASDSDLSRELAMEKADLNAQGELRRFMGEFISVNKAEKTSSSLKEYSDSLEEFKSNEKLEKNSKAIGDKLGMSGAKKVYTWNAVHPANGQKVYGSVYVYSVSQARAANKLYFDFKKAGGAAGGAGSLGIAPPPTPPASPAKKATPTGKDSSGAGAEGDAP